MAIGNRIERTWIDGDDTPRLGRQPGLAFWMILSILAKMAARRVVGGTSDWRRSSRLGKILLTAYVSQISSSDRGNSPGRGCGRRANRRGDRCQNKWRYHHTRRDRAPAPVAGGGSPAAGRQRRPAGR